MRPLHCLIAFLIGVCLGLINMAIYIAYLEFTAPNSTGLFNRSVPQIDTVDLPQCPAPGHTLGPIPPLFTSSEHLTAYDNNNNNDNNNDNDNMALSSSMTRPDLHIEIGPRRAYETALQGSRFATIILVGLAVGGLIKLVLDWILGLL